MELNRYYYSLTGMNRWILWGIAAMLMGAVISSIWVVVHSDRLLRKELLQEARLVERGLDPQNIEKLSGTGKDLQKEDYWRLKGHLSRVSLANDDIRFLYILGRKDDGSLFIYLDSEPEGSKDYSPPGQAYPEAPDAYRRAFDRTAPVVTGFVQDRWGTWMSALVPVFNPTTGELLAVMGMDIDSKVWQRKVAMTSAFPVGLIAALFVMAALGLVLMHSRARLKDALSRIRTLSGFLPICASCKKIRNDKGYWEQLEKYISENTDAVLSHGICPECAQKLYPDVYRRLNSPRKE